MSSTMDSFSCRDSNGRQLLRAYETLKRTTRIVMASRDGCSPNLVTKDLGVNSRMSLGIMYPRLTSMDPMVLYTRKRREASEESGVEPSVDVMLHHLTFFVSFRSILME